MKESTKNALCENAKLQITPELNVYEATIFFERITNLLKPYILKESLINLNDDIKAHLLSTAQKVSEYFKSEFSNDEDYIEKYPFTVEGARLFLEEISEYINGEFKIKILSAECHLSKYDTVREYHDYIKKRFPTPKSGFLLDSIFDEANIFFCDVLEYLRNPKLLIKDTEDTLTTDELCTIGLNIKRFVENCRYTEINSDFVNDIEKKRLTAELEAEKEKKDYCLLAIEVRDLQEDSANIDKMMLSVISSLLEPERLIKQMDEYPLIVYEKILPLISLRKRLDSLFGILEFYDLKIKK